MRLSHSAIQLLALCQFASASPCKPSSLSSDSVIPTSTDIELSATLSTETATSTTVDHGVTVSEAESASSSTGSSALVSTSIAEPTTTAEVTADSSASVDATTTTTGTDIETATAGETTTAGDTTTTGITTTDTTTATTTAATTSDSPTTTSDVPKPTNCADLDSTYTDIIGLSYSISCNVDVSTYTITRLISGVPNFVACIEACSPEADCVAANYDKSGRLCYLLSEAEVPYDNPFYDTAYKQAQ